MEIGAGTVTEAEQVALTKEAGGTFIISPNTDERVIRRTAELGLVSIPGALTPTEIAAAHSYGADFVKLFPIGSFGTGYVKAVSAPLGNVPLLAVGGVDLNNVREYMKSGIVGVGIGSNIIRKDLLEEEKFDEISELAREYVNAVTSVGKKG